MRYAVVYSSRTGNTALLAQTIRDMCTRDACLYFGAPDAQALAAQTLFVGFWTDKGTCDEQTARFLEQLTDQRVFLFGTAGFGGAPEYFEQILSRVKAHMGQDVQLIGTYMCQGKMPQQVRDRYASMEDSPRRTAMLQNFDQALGHPDAQDLARLKSAVEQCV
jgi:flavodoxin I